MKRKIITCVSIFCFGLAGYAQVGIGTKTPSSSAQLDITSDNKGILIPRIELTSLTSFTPIIGNASDPLNIGLLVYNKSNLTTTVDNTSVTIEKGFFYWTGTEWTRITDRKELVTMIRTETTEQLTNIQNIINNLIPTTTGGGSSVVVYDPATNEFVTIIVNPDGTITQQPIDISKAIAKQETKTFIKPKYDNGDPTTGKINGYYYFGEKAISDWLAIPANTTSDPFTSMPVTATGVFLMDINSVITENIQNIFEDNSQIINEIVNNAQGNVVVVKENDNWVIKYVDTDTNGNSILVDLNFNSFETKTTISKRVDTSDTTKGAYALTNVEPTASNGAIIYEYSSENGKYYIDITQDISNSITNNEALKTIIQNTVSQHINTGGNVYFGQIDGEDKLFTRDAQGNHQVINIAESILEVLENSTNTIIERIKDGLSSNITSTVSKTNIKINGKNIYTYEVTFTAVDNNAEISNVAIPASFANNIASIYDIKILSQNGSIIKKSIDDIVIGNNSFTFSLGENPVYTPIASGTYKAIIEFTAINEPTP